MLSFNASNHNGNMAPRRCCEFQIKHILTMRGLVLGLTLSEVSDKHRSKLLSTKIN